MSYTGLGVIAAATTNLHYKDTREVAMALAKAFNEDFKELADNGCDIIQLDEFVWPYGMGDWEIEALNASVEGVNCEFWVHTCWGNYSGTPAYFPDETKTEFGAFVLDKRASDAPAPERAHAIFPHVLDANITALNYEVGRTGPDDLKPLPDNDWTKTFVAGRHRREVDRHRERGRGRRPDPAGAGVRPRRPARPVHRLRADQPAPDDRRGQAAGAGRRRRPGPGRDPGLTEMLRPARGPARSGDAPRRLGQGQRNRQTSPCQDSETRGPACLWCDHTIEREAHRARVSQLPQAAGPVGQAPVPRPHPRAGQRADPGRDPGLPGQAGHLVDIVKVGWGIGYVDPLLEERVGICADHDCPVSLGGTLLEVAALQDRVGELRDWALKVGITHIEVSNGLRALPASRKHALVRELAADFVVLAETGAKEGNYPPTPAEWAEEMARDLDAGRHLGDRRGPGERDRRAVPRRTRASARTWSRPSWTGSRRTR